MRRRCERRLQKLKLSLDQPHGPDGEIGALGEQFEIGRHRRHATPGPNQGLRIGRAISQGNFRQLSVGDNSAKVLAIGVDDLVIEHPGADRERVAFLGKIVGYLGADLEVAFVVVAERVNLAGNLFFVVPVQ